MRAILDGLALILALVSSAAEPQDDWPEAHLRQSDLEAHLRFIASDELAGRLTGTAGNDVAARYIAEQFRAAGVESPPGIDNYLQAVPLARTRPPEQRGMTLPGHEWEKEEVLVVAGAPFQLESEVVYAGYGRSGLHSGPDDFDGLNVSGKIVAVRFGLPGSRRRGFSAMAEKRRAALARGAVALIEFYDDARWKTLTRLLGRARISLDGDIDSEEIPHLLVRDPKGRRLAQLEDKTDVEASLQASRQRRQPIRSSNVLGLIPGADPALSHEYLILTAHYDHLGSGEALPGATEGDSIFNGARDNGMGVVALLAAARALASKPPARSILLAAVTGEEEGLLGSRYYVAHPPVTLDQTVFDLNADGAGFTDTGVVTLIGLERSSASEQLRAACQDSNLEAIPEPAGERSFFGRSDNASFARKGVPSLTFSPGFRAFDAKIMRYYHQPGDEADDRFDYGYLSRFCQAFTRAARYIANHPARPHWTPGDRFETVARTRYGSG
ncbi:MAG: M28 family peptidase [Acidobacteriota bacterium]